MDGKTIAIPPRTHYHEKRETPGFGCPHCGRELDLLVETRIWYGLSCCGFSPEGKELARLLNARRLLIDLRDGTGDSDVLDQLREL